MVDFHSHILPGIDDGSRDYEESVALLREAKKAGFDKVISTSHYAIKCYEVPEYKRKELISELQVEQDIPKIILGSEIYLTHNILDLLVEYNASTINDTNYILFELPLRGSFVDLKKLLIKIQESDYRLILAHPERYQMVHKDFNLLKELQEMGVLFQSNYGSILGLYGWKAKSTLKKMLKNGYVDFLGTDVHRKESVYPMVEKAIAKISKYVSSEVLEDITTNNAEYVIRGEDVYEVD